MRRTLLVKIELMESTFSYGSSDRPKHFKDPLFHQYHVEVKQCRYDALDGYLNHLLFAIVMREAKLHQPAGSSGKPCPNCTVVSEDAGFYNASFNRNS